MSETTPVDSSTNKSVPKKSRNVKSAKIPVQWMSLTRHPTNEELIALANEVTRQGIAPDAINQVRGVWNQLATMTTVPTK
jgi:hypothetical protein